MTNFRCIRCQGSGYSAPGVVCQRCHGDGTIEIDEADILFEQFLKATKGYRASHVLYASAMMIAYIHRKYSPGMPIEQALDIIGQAVAVELISQDREEEELSDHKKVFDVLSKNYPINERSDEEIANDLIANHEEFEGCTVEELLPKIDAFRLSMPEIVVNGTKHRVCISPPLRYEDVFKLAFPKEEMRLDAKITFSWKHPTKADVMPYSGTMTPGNGTVVSQDGLSFIVE